MFLGLPLNSNAIFKASAISWLLGDIATPDLIRLRNIESGGWVSLHVLV